MAEKGSLYYNAIAEKVNGIFKIKFLLEQRFSRKHSARASVKETIKIYNEESLHMSISYKTLAEKYSEKTAA